MFCKYEEGSSINDLVADCRGLIVKLSKIKNSYLTVRSELDKKVSFLTIAVQREVVVSLFYK